MAHAHVVFEVFHGFWSRSYVEARPRKLFVFGDNEARHGRAGQAVIRGCANAHGIPTKKRPSMREDAFWTDEEYDANVAALCAAFIVLHDKLRRFDAVVLPAAGLGTGLAQLPARAPRTFAFLQAGVAHLKRQCTAPNASNCDGPK